MAARWQTGSLAVELKAIEIPAPVELEAIQIDAVESWRSIFRAPFSLRQVDEEAYKPKIVCLGPYHHGDPIDARFQEMEQKKRHCLRRFLDRLNIPDVEAPTVSQKLEHCMQKLRQHKDTAKSYYSETITLGTKQFVEMLLLDGCFILEVMRQPKVIDTPWKYQLVFVDMLMLENQIPFLILNELRLLETRQADAKAVVLGFAQKHISTDCKLRETNPEPLHFLHLIRMLMVPNDQQPENQTCREKKIPSDFIKGSAVQLREVGIKFKSKNQGAAPLEVSFHGGVLEMTQLKIYDDFRFLLRNLVAFEQCYLKDGRYVTDYAFFVDRLIRTARDVALLHEKGVVVNGLGSDEEVAELVNGLCRNAVWNSESNALRDVFLELNRHFNSRWSRWRAKLTRDYFHSPWSVISFLAACLFLILAATQTYFTVRYRKGCV